MNRERYETPTRLVVLACGNPSRGDDALGPNLLHLLEETYSSEYFDFIEDFQLQVEHALDLEGCDLALFIDASVSCPPPFVFERLQPQPERSYTTHALHPAAILHVYQQIKDFPPPPAFLLSIRGEHFELGEPLSESAKNNLAAAWQFVRQLLDGYPNLSWEREAQ